MKGAVVFQLTDAQVAVLFDAAASRQSRSFRAFRALSTRGFLGGTVDSPRLTDRGVAVFTMLGRLGFLDER